MDAYLHLIPYILAVVLKWLSALLFDKLPLVWEMRLFNDFIFAPVVPQLTYLVTHQEPVVLQIL